MATGMRGLTGVYLSIALGEKKIREQQPDAGIWRAKGESHVK
jgi:hypothetical protein